MSTLINGFINVAKLPREKFVKGKDGAVYYNLTISVGDETRFGYNVALFDSQTIEEREALKERNYVGKGRVVWTDGNVVLAEKEETEEDTVPDTEATPF